MEYRGLYSVLCSCSRSGRLLSCCLRHEIKASGARCMSASAVPKYKCARAAADCLCLCLRGAADFFSCGRNLVAFIVRFFGSSLARGSVTGEIEVAAPLRHEMNFFPLGRIPPRRVRVQPAAAPLESSGFGGFFVAAPPTDNAHSAAMRPEGAKPARGTDTRKTLLQPLHWRESLRCIEDTFVFLSTAIGPRETPTQRRCPIRFDLA